MMQNPFSIEALDTAVLAVSDTNADAGADADAADRSRRTVLGWQPVAHPVAGETTATSCHARQRHP